jgi:tetratricopeptide (TPR) repeat protein
VLDLWAGDLDAVAALAARTLDTSRRTGNRWDEWAAQQLAARVLRLHGQFGPAVELLEAALAIVVDGAATYFELWVRPDLARALAAVGRVDEAGEQLARCRAIAEDGEDWRGRAGAVAFAEAVTLAHDDRPDDADQAFARARALLAAHKLRSEEAELLHEWGRLLGAPDRLDEAGELLRRHGAGSFWLGRVAADRRRVG